MRHRSIFYLQCCDAAYIHNADAANYRVNPSPLLRTDKMAKLQTPDFTKAFENLFASADTTAFNDVFKNAAEFNSKISDIAIKAAEKNAELSQAWTKETLNKLETVTKPQTDPKEYAQVITDFTTAQAKATPEHITAFAEVAKKAQMDTIELLLSAGQEAQTKATTAVKKTTRKAS